MNKRDELYDLIENYLQGNLENSEKILFEERISNDDSLRLRIKMHQLANDLVIERRLQKVKEAIEEEKNRQQGSSKRFYYWTIVSFIIVAGLSVITYFNTRETSTSGKSLATNPQRNKVEPAIRAIDIPSSTTTKLPVPKSILKPLQRISVNNNRSVKMTDSVPPEIIAAVQVEKEMAKIPDPVITETEISQPDVCSNIRLQADVEIKEACVGSSDGSIQLGNYKGGIPPYHYSVKDETGTVRFAKGLEPGNYEVFLLDGNNCKTVFRNLNVPQKTCSKDYILNMGESAPVIIPHLVQEGHFKVFDQSGQLIREQNLEGNQAIWNGTDRNDVESSKGYYIFVIEYQDGSVEKGTITILK